MPVESCMIETTAMVIDIRNFTPNLLHSRAGSGGKPRFCDFLERFLNTCFECALCAFPEGKYERPPVYVQSTGDGLLAVFLSENHFVEAYLAGILIFKKVKELCDRYNRRLARELPRTSFGIGLESGRVCQVRTSKRLEKAGLGVETYIGNAINIAARVEGVTKILDRTNLIVSDRTNRLLCKRFFKVDYQNLVDRGLDPKVDGKERRRYQTMMAELNSMLLLQFMHRHILEGVDPALSLYRLSESLASPSRPEFRRLTRDFLTGGDAEHYKRVMALLEKNK